MRRVLGLACCALALAPAGASAARLRLAPDRLGPILLGMTAAEASDALGARVERTDSLNACEFFRYPGMPQGGGLIATRGKHIDLIAGGFRTTRGIKIGDSVRRLHRRYGRRLKRVPKGNYLGAATSFFGVTKRRDGRTYLLRFPIFEGKVAFIEAGRRRLVINHGECA